jgi:hypothetical protein
MLNSDISKILQKMGDSESYQRHLELANIIKERIDLL